MIPHRPADEGAERERAGKGEGEGRHPRLRAAQRLEDPRRGEAADVGREGHREVEAAGEDRDQHREGEDAELGHLERDRLERGEGEEARVRPAEEDEHRNEEDPEPDVLAPPAPEKGGEIEAARRGGSRLDRARLAQARLRLRLRRIGPPRPSSVSHETFVVVIAARSTTPISIWNA